MTDEKEQVARSASFTHEEDEHAGHLYYFTPDGAASPPYTTQRVVRAIIDIADDGTLAGVELIDNMPPPPTSRPLAPGAPLTFTRWDVCYGDFEGELKEEIDRMGDWVRYEDAAAAVAALEADRDRLINELRAARG